MHPHLTLRTAAVPITLAIALILAAGCRVETHGKGEGTDNVKIAAPFGGMSVKTDDSVAQSTGLPTYPGATIVKKDKDTGTADINLAIGGFQFRVKAVSYRTADSPEQVATFYRKALGHFGDVIQCVHNAPVGTPTRTSEGLTCDDDSRKKINISDDSTNHIQLKAGSKSHQHLVEIGPEGSGTKFGLVELDLPSHVVLGNDNDKDKDTRQ